MKTREEESDMQWQPIETAPKDGRLILGFDARYLNQGKHAQEYGARRDEDGDFYRVAPYEVVCWLKRSRSKLIQIDRDTFKRVSQDDSYWARSQGSWSPTHWMPLPNPPAPKIKE